MIYDHFIGMTKELSHPGALVFNDRVFSSAALYRKVRGVSHRLRELGITRQHRIGIVMGNTPFFVCSLLAAAKIRAGAVLFSTHFKTYELENYINDSHIRIMICDQSSAAPIRQLSHDKQLIHQDHDPVFGHLEIWRLLRQDDSSDIIPITGDWQDKEFTLQFTSGVGGRSKIVPRSYRQVLDEIISYTRAIELTSRDVVICPAPFFHAYGLINGFLAPFYQGATAILMQRFIPNDFINLVKNHKPTIFIGVPMMYDMLGKTYLEENVDFSSLRICFSAGAKLSPEVAQRFTGRFGVCINQQYGSTETGTIAVNLYHDGFDNVNSVGLPLPGREIEVVDQEDGELAVGTEGEIKILSPGTSRGYLHLEALNQEKFKEGWYYTGDIGWMDANDHIFITGRKIAFINVAGLKVDPFEVEGILLSIKGIKECAVVGKQDKTKHREMVKAFVVADEDKKQEKQLAVENIKKSCKDKLANYKVPEEIEFVDQLPKSPTGKILMKYLLD
ncbi:MAG: class I adenylate-forming enzyme family protein [Candidatus Aminicenantes bacterium]